MSDNILNDIKDLANIEASDTAFDGQIKLYINGAFSSLNQVGVGPPTGFRIADGTEEWDAFLEDGSLLDKVKEYIALRVRYEWDSPGTGYHTTALKELVDEALVRISYAREDTDWVPPEPEDPIDIDDPFGDPIVLDGG